MASEKRSPSEPRCSTVSRRFSIRTCCLTTFLAAMLAPLRLAEGAASDYVPGREEWVQYLLSDESCSKMSLSESLRVKHKNIVQGASILNPHTVPEADHMISIRLNSDDDDAGFEEIAAVVLESSEGTKWNYRDSNGNIRSIRRTGLRNKGTTLTGCGGRRLVHFVNQKKGRRKTEEEIWPVLAIDNSEDRDISVKAMYALSFDSVNMYQTDELRMRWISYYEEEEL